MYIIFKTLTLLTSNYFRSRDIEKWGLIILVIKSFSNNILYKQVTYTSERLT
jgi:hypothetical protein